MNRLHVRLVLLLSGSIPGPLASSQETPEVPPDLQPMIRRVDFEGLSHVSEAFCRGQMVSAAGRAYSRTVVDEDVRRLIRSGKFLDVRAETTSQDGQIVLTIQVQERPLITAVEFRGNVKFSAKQLLKELDLKAGDPLSSFAVQQSASAIEQRYREAGYAAVRVTVDREAMQTERRVIFDVEEGPRIRLRQISFEGNDSFSERDLRSKISLRTYVPVLRTGEFSPQVAERDAAEVQNFYRERGYLDARVSYRTDTLPPADDLRVVFVVEEGDVYTIARVVLSGNSALTEEELLSVMRLRPGAVMRLDLLRQDVENLTRRYGEMGYIYAVVRPTRAFTEQAGEVDVSLEIDEGQPYVVGRIQVRGNLQTQDRVVRRELEFFPDELFNTTEIASSEDNLRSTGIFRLVKISPDPTSPEGNVRDVLVEVLESDRNTHFIVGGGVGSNSGLAGTLSYEARNFDLLDWPRTWGEFIRGRAFRGAGQYFRAQVSPGSQLSSFRIDFREPYLAHRPLRLGTSFYLFERGRSDYDEQRLGSIISLGRPIERGLLKGWSSEVAFRIEDVKIDDLPWFPAEDITDAQGHNLILSFQGSLVRNRTDRRFFPTRGDVWSVSYEQAVGDHTFGKLELGYRWYKTTTVDHQDRPSVLGLKVESGYIFDEAPVFERFYAGGLGSLRGFEFRGVSPRDGLFIENAQRVGGHFQLLAGAEYSFPVISETLRGVVFSDMGTVEEDLELTAWRTSVGVGVRIYIENYFGPIPLEFNLAAPVARDSDDDTQIFSFAVGVTF